MTCPSCSQELAERGAFCKWCGAQARCTSCKEVLEPQAKACVECGILVGTPLDVGKADHAKTLASALTELPVNRNTITWREDRNTRDFQASLTDASMQTVGGFFGELFANRVGRAMQPVMSRFQTRDAATVEITQPQLPPPEPEQQQDQSAQAGSTPTNGQAKEQLLKIFNLQGQVLELSDDRLKAKSAADYYKRLTYLFLYAQEVLLGRTSTPRSELSTVLTAAKINNGNCRFWLGQKKGFTVDAEDRMKLVTGSREQAIKVVGEILDSDLADQWHPDTRTAKARGPRKKK